MSDKDMKLRLIVEAKNEAGAELERLHEQAKRSGSAVAGAYQQAFALIGASTADVYGQMRLQYGADAAEFARVTGDKETAYALYAKRLIELERSAAASHRSLATVAAEAFAGGIRSQVDDFARSLVGVASAAKTTKDTIAPLDADLDELRQATGLSSEAFADLQARFAQTTAEQAQENALLSIARAAVLSRAEIDQLGRTMGLNSAQIDRVTTAAHGAAPAINTLVSLSQTAQNALGKGADASVAGLAQDLTALSQGGRIAQSSLDGLGTELEELRRHSQLTDAQFAALQAKFQRTSAERMQEQALRNLAASCNLTEKEIRELGTQFGLSHSQIEGVIGSTRKAETSLFSLGTVARGALAYFSLQTLVTFGQGVLDTTVQVDSLHRSLVAIYGSQSQAAAQMEFLRQTADRTGQNVYQLVDSYKTLSASTQGTILEGEATRKIFAAISEAGAVLGMSNERVKLSFMAVSQMASKGVVSMEDLRGQLGESLPGALRLFAEGMGKSTEEFIAMVDKGEVLSAELIKLASAIHATYGEAAETAGLESAQGAINKMAEAWTDLKANLIESDTAVAGINKVTAAIKTLAEYAGLRSIWNTFTEGAELANQGLLDFEAFSKATFLERQKMVDDLTRTENIAAKSFTANWQAAERQSMNDYAVYTANRSKVTEKQHQETLKYIETEQQRLEAAHQAALKGAKSDEERLAVDKRYQEEKAKLAEREAKTQEQARQTFIRYTETKEQALARERDAALAVAKTEEERQAVSKQYQQNLADLHEREGKAAESAAKKAARSAEQQQREYQGIIDRLLPLEVATREYHEALAALDKMDPTHSTENYQVALANLNHEYEAATESANRYAKEAEEAKKAMEEAQRAAAESELSRQGTAIEISIAQGNLSEIDALPFQIDLLEKRLRLQQELLADMQKSTPEEINAWNSQADAIYRTTLELAEYQQRLRLLDPLEAFKQGLKDYGSATNTSLLDFYGSALPDAMDNSTEAISQFFRDFGQGNAELSESWEALGETVEDTVFDILQELLQLQLKMAMLSGLGVTATGGITGGGLLGLFTGWHDGGTPGVDQPTFVRALPLSMVMNSPRFHTGLKSKEFIAILEEGETVLTEDDTSMIGKRLSAKQGAPQVNMTIIEAPGVKAETQTTTNNDGSLKVLVKMVRQEIEGEMGRGQGLHRSLGSLYGMRRRL